MKKFELGPIQKKWIQSLKDHPERQMKERLGKKKPDGSYFACCLGELGLIAGVCEWNNDGELVSCGVNGSEATLFIVWKEVGLRDSCGNSHNRNLSLAGYNDRGKTWPEIAAIVEANPEEYFTHAV